MNNPNEVKFEFGWLALKMLGKNLYSNIWSAISELVANGFDAGAKNVYIYINSVNKSNSVIEIIDDGSGMNREGINTYVKVGFNKRINAKKKDDGYLLMGRKGIGKLAALYLTDKYFLISKTADAKFTWEMQFHENDKDKDEKPFLRVLTKDITVDCSEIWEKKCKTGTALRLEKVNLTGLGNIAYAALARKLSNIFALDSMDNRKIYLLVKEKDNQPNKFQIVTKKIAFKNMAFIEYKSEGSSTLISDILEAKNRVIRFPYTKLNGTQYYPHTIDVSEFSATKENVKIKGSGTFKDVNGNEIKKTYSLNGWIGLHSTIDRKAALENDPLFSKDKFYNPIQLRLYVRNKLAIENFLNILNNTQAFVNYIEGEIHFDILDDDELPDIATSNRQGLDEQDERILLLKNIVTDIVNRLIRKRAALADLIKKNEDELKSKQDDNAKKQFTSEVDKELSDIDELSDSTRQQLSTTISNKIKGDVTPKSDYKLFISHSSVDRCITDFIYYILRHVGVKEEEIFYTSKEDCVNQFENIDALAKQIKDNIIKQNVLLLYLTSNAYKKSEFCMFEGGAGWATRGIGEYITLTLTYEELPKFITNGKMEFVLENEKNIPLNRKTYLFVVRMLNRIIEHLNAGRRMNNENEIPLFKEIDIPLDDVMLKKQKKKLENFFNSDIKEYWKNYIQDNLKDYMNQRYPDKKTLGASNVQN